MTDKAESKEVAKSEEKAEEKPADDAVKSEDKAEGEEGEKDEAKAEGEEDAEKAEEPKVFKYKHSNHATAEEHESSPYMWIRTKVLTQAINQDVEKTQSALKDVFAEKFGVEVPKIKLPLLMQLYVEMRSLEDKLKVLTDSHRPYPKKPGANRAPPDVVTQTVVVRGEVYEDAKRGTLAEALEELLPHRNTSYKDQLTLKAKELDETFDELLKDCNETIAKDRKYQNPTPIEKPTIDSIVPLVPNVGYDRNVFIDLEKDTKGKITAGIRVHYEKDEVKKVFLVPVSECVHIAPPIVKAAEAVAAHLTSEKFPVFGPKINSSGCLFGLKFAMNDIGEIILSIVLVIDDKFLDEFYDLNVEEDIQRAIDDYYSKLASGKIKPADESKVNGEDEDGDEKEEEKGEEDAKKAETETKTEDEKKTEGDKKEEAKAEDKADVNGAEPKEDSLVIMRESSTIPIALDKSPFLNRVEDQVKDHLNKYTASLKKFFEAKCEALGISGIYITWRATNQRPTEWNRNVKHWYHVCGSKSVPETVNSIKFELYPHLEGYNPTRTQILPTLMNLLVDNLGIDSNSQVVVACDYFVVQNFFAQKCKKTVMMSFLNEMLRKDIKERSKDSVAFVSAKAKQMNIVDRCKRHFGGDSPHALIHWGHFQDNPVKKLFQHRVKRVGVVFEARERNFSQQNNNTQQEVMRKMNLAMFPMYKLKKVVGVDICPQRTGPVTLVAFYDAVQGHIPFYNNRGMKRRNNFSTGGPNAKRPAGGNRPNQGGMGGRPRNNMNNMPGKRRGGPGGPMGGSRGGGGGGGGGRGGYFPKRQRMDDRRPPPMQQRGGPRNRFNQRGPDRPAPMGGRQPNPWNDQRGDRYNDRGNYNDGQPEHTVQAAKAVLSQLNTIIENQMILAQMGQTPRPEDDWVRPPARDSFGSAPRGGGGLPAYGNEPAGFFARDVSPPSSIGGYRQSEYGGGRNRDFGGGRMGGGAGGNRRGGGGGGGNKGFRRRN